MDWWNRVWEGGGGGGGGGGALPVEICEECGRVSVGAASNEADVLHT